MTKIESASIKYPAHICDGDGKAVVTAKFEDGTSGEVLRFYPDELFFHESEFVGLTREGVSDLFRRKDIAYLQS